MEGGNLGAEGTSRSPLELLAENKGGVLIYQSPGSEWSSHLPFLVLAAVAVLMCLGNLAGLGLMFVLGQRRGGVDGAAKSGGGGRRRGRDEAADSTVVEMELEQAMPIPDRRPRAHSTQRPPLQYPTRYPPIHSRPLMRSTPATVSQSAEEGRLASQSRLYTNQPQIGSFSVIAQVEPIPMHEVAEGEEEEEVRAASVAEEEIEAMEPTALEPTTMVAEEEKEGTGTQLFRNLKDLSALHRSLGGAAEPLNQSASCPNLHQLPPLRPLSPNLPLHRPPPPPSTRNTAVRNMVHIYESRAGLHP